MSNDQNEHGKLNRREFLGITGKAGAATLIATAGGMSLGLVRVAAAAGTKNITPFNFAIITDGHLYDIPDHRFDAFLEKAVADVNAMKPLPDFVVYTGDIAQAGLRAELEKGKRILSKLKVPVKYIPGEHDWYLDMGAAWRELFGNPTWSFDHKGVHLIGMNSILVRDFWTANKLTPEQRMGAMMELEGHGAGLWGVRDEQLAWLKKKDVANLSPDTPVVVFTHSPLWDYYPRWNFQTEDAPQIREILAKFDRVMAFHGHVHQVVYNRTGNMSHVGCLSTSWPWPYPDVALPFPNIRLNRSAPGDFMDGLGSQFINLEKDFSGKAGYMTWADALPPAVKNGIKL